MQIKSVTRLADMFNDEIFKVLYNLEGPAKIETLGKRTVPKRHKRKILVLNAITTRKTAIRGKYVGEL